MDNRSSQLQVAHSLRIGSQPCGAPLASNAPPAPQLLGDAQLRFAVDVSKPGNLRRLGTVTREPGQPLAPGHHHRASTHRVVIDVLLQRGPHSHLVIGTWAGGAWRRRARPKRDQVSRSLVPLPGKYEA